MKQQVLFSIALTFATALSYAQSGRVGIGESSPGSKGSIKGNLSVGSTFSSQTAPTNGAIIEGQTSIGVASPDASAKLQIDATDAGILIPRVTTAQRNAIASPATGLLVYVTDNTKGFWYYDGTAWVQAIGPKGNTGASGTKGDTGTPGTAGANGATGAAGANGATGAKGDTGAKGATGANGTNGVTGPKGDTGAAGANGATGAAGANGATGATGFLQNGTAAGQTPYWNGSTWKIDQNIYNNGGNIGISTTSSLTQKLNMGGNVKLDDNMMVEGNTSYRVYRNLASYSAGSGAAGAFVINTSQPWNSACMFRVKIEGYFYDATSPFETTIGGYMYTNNDFYNKGYINIGANNLSVRFARNTSTNTVAIILGNEGSSYSYPKLTVTSFMQGHSGINEAYADGWSISQITSLTGYDYTTTVPNVTTLPSGSGNYIQNQTTADQSAGFRINGNGLFNGGSVGIGTTTPTQKLTVAGNINKLNSWIVGDAVWGVNNFEVHNSSWDGVTNGNYGGIIGGHGYYYNGLQSGGSSGNEAGDGELYVSGKSMLIGNVGIGTASPTEKLHVAGKIKMVDGNQAAGKVLTSDVNGVGTWQAPKYNAYTIPNTGSTAQWLKLGTLTISQQGKSAFFKIISNNGYNASNAQNFEVYLRFKTSNASSVDANGFAGDAAYWYSGANAQFASSGNIKIKANAAGGSATAYDIFINLAAYTGDGSFYTVETTEGTWAHSGATGQTDPGAGSSTVLVVSRQSNSAGQSVTSSTSTTETQLLSNNTGTYSNAAGAGWTPGTWQSTGFSVTKTITSGNMVQIAVTARVEGDNYNYYVPSCAYFRLVRGSTILATTAVYLTAANYVPSSFWYFNSGNLSMNYVDTGISGSQTYTLQYWLPNENSSYSEVIQLGERNMHVIELAQ